MEEVLFRKKEAFSDGVSGLKRSWYQIIQEFANKQYNTDCEFFDNYKENVPTTIEAKYFRKVFTQKFGLIRDDIIPNYWQPKWDKDGNELKGYIDPSARVLDVYNQISS